MKGESTYYRVDLATGITVERRPYGFYTKSVDLGVTVFKGLQDAKRRFDAITKAEIARLRAMRKTLRAVRTRADLLERLGSQ